MHSRASRTLASIIAAIILVLIGVVIAKRPIATGGAPAPAAAAQPGDTTREQQGGYMVSADQASSIALASAPGATVTGAPMLVSYKDAIFYEVTLDTGMVYVDVTSGQVITSTAVTAGDIGQEDHNRGTTGKGDD